MSGDFEKKYLKIPHLMEQDLGGSHSVKKAAPEGTPDKEAQNRSKMPSTDMVPRALVPERSDAVTKVEMSAATISALQAMMRTEIQHGLMDMEQRFNNEADKSVDELRTQFMEELREEKKMPVKLWNEEFVIWKTGVPHHGKCRQWILKMWTNQWWSLAASLKKPLWMWNR